MLFARSTRIIGTFSESWICASCRNKQLARGAFSGLSYQPPSRDSDSAVLKRKFHASPFRSTKKTLPGSNTKVRDVNLPETPARTRFAPSPTGYMHIGGLRTALFSYLLAKRTNGQFLLRIEDTDQKRLVADAEQRLCEDLQWAGLHWDEGPDIGGPYGPYRQSERNEIYRKHAHELLDNGSAYRCFCTPQTTGASGGKAAYVTSGCYQDCSSLSSEEAQDRAISKKELFTVRLRQPKDVHKRVYKDLIYGKIQRLKRSPSASAGGEDDESGIDAADTILVKSDGTPTYHFANVVDDHLMKITHVIRGTEWMASTPLHYDLYTAFGWTPPAFAHVGLLVDENKTKLSKRSDTGLVLDVKGMREQNGVLPEVLTNFLALLGWSNPGRDDVLNMAALTQNFDLKFTKGNTVVKTEKLWYLQKQHIDRELDFCRDKRTLDREPIRSVISQIEQAAIQKFGPDLKKEIPNARYKTLKDYIADILLIDSKSYSTPAAYVERNRYFFVYDPTEEPSLPVSYEEFGYNITEADLHHVVEMFLWTNVKTKQDHPNDTLDGHITFAAAEFNKIIDDDIFFKLNFVLGYIYDSSTDSYTPEYKAWKKALMRYLRERLSYGLPGPSILQIMMVLGYRECCRRLMVPVDIEGRDW